MYIFVLYIFMFCGSYGVFSLVLPITEEHFRKNGLCLYFSLLIAVMVPSLVSETVLLVTEPLSAQWCGNLTGGL